MNNDKLTSEELAVWHMWKSVYHTIYGRILKDVSEQTDLSEGDFDVLSRLVDLGNGVLRQQQLADSMKWDKSRLSHHLTRMEKRGLITRQPLEAERGVQVVITQAGSVAYGHARPVHTKAVREHLLSHLTVEDLVLLVNLQDIADPEV